MKYAFPTSNAADWWSEKSSNVYERIIEPPSRDVHVFHQSVLENARKVSRNRPDIFLPYPYLPLLNTIFQSHSSLCHIFSRNLKINSRFSDYLLLLLIITPKYFSLLPIFLYFRIRSGAVFVPFSIMSIPTRGSHSLISSWLVGSFSMVKVARAWNWQLISTNCRD
jgi:hypothetical protein